MNKKMNNIVVLIGFSVPYVFLAMVEDLTFGSMWMYALMIIALISLTRYAIKHSIFIPQLIGNIISYMGSYWFISLHEGDKWGWYFKPLAAIGLLNVVTIIIVVLQVISWVLNKSKNKTV